MKKHLIALAIGFTCLSQLTFASDTTNLNVSATVLGTCKFSGPANLAFGSLDPSIGGNVSQSTTISFWCTKGASYTLAAGNGANFDTTNNIRRMKGPGASDLIPYALSLASATGTGSGKGTPINVTVNGSILSTDYVNASVGAYSDTVQMSITP